MKYKEWASVWLNEYIKPTAKRRTYETYQQVLNIQILPKLGNIKLSRLTPFVIQTFISELLRNGNIITGKGLSPNTVNLIITVIQHSLRAAYTSNVTQKYTADKIKRPMRNKSSVTCFSVSEQKRIEKAAVNDKRKKMFGIVLCLYTGLRIGELLALTWKDVDFKNNLISINKTCHDGNSKNGFERLIGEPKTQTSVRIIPLPKQILRKLKEIKNSEKSVYVVSHCGKAVPIRSYQRSFSLLLKKLKIPHKGFHSLRHTFATRAVECGMDVKCLSEILGHKNTSITLNLYTHSLLDQKQFMMNKLGKNFVQ